MENEKAGQKTNKKQASFDSYQKQNDIKDKNLNLFIKYLFKNQVRLNNKQFDLFYNGKICPLICF